MEYSITAVIAPLHIDEEQARQYDIPVFKENGFAIIAFDDLCLDYWSDKLSIPNYYDFLSKLIILDCPMLHVLAQAICEDKYALIEINYSREDHFAVIESQYAGVFCKHGVIKRIKEDAVNDCLSFIGVERKEGYDEYASINLGKYTDFDEYFEKYHDMSEQLISNHTA